MSSRISTWGVGRALGQVLVFHPSGFPWGARALRSLWSVPRRSRRRRRRKEGRKDGRKQGQSRTSLFRSGGVCGLPGAPTSPEAPDPSKNAGAQRGPPPGRAWDRLSPSWPEVTSSTNLGAKGRTQGLGCFRGRGQGTGSPTRGETFCAFSAGPYGEQSINYRSFLINNRLI